MIKEWISQHKLQVNWLNEKSFKIEGVGVFVHIEPKNNKIIGSDMELLVDEDDESYIDKDCNFFVFQFGKNYYYCEIKQITIDKVIQNTVKRIVEVYKSDFIDFRWLGTIERKMDIDFPQLGIHTEYELLNGSHQCEMWCKKLKYLSTKSAAICDRNTLGGTLSFQTSCKDNDIKPIIGMTASVYLDCIVTDNYFDLIDIKLYCINEIGWNNLLQINKKINVDNDSFILFSQLLEHSSGLVAVISTNNHFSDIPENQVNDLIKELKSNFDYAYYQIDCAEFVSNQVDVKHLERIKHYIYNFSITLSPVLICDNYYIDSDMYVLKQFLNGVDKKASNDSKNQHLKDFDEIMEQNIRLFSSKSEHILYNSISNSLYINDLCNFQIPVGDHKLPKYENTTGEDNFDLFFRLIEEGVNEKLVGKVDNIDLYLERIKIETDLIVRAQFIDYFLILWDMIKFAKDSDILVGIGRGSACGSLVYYLLGVTGVDPLKYDLLWERFMNEARLLSKEGKAMQDILPDTDNDVLSERREEVKQHLIDFYGEQFVCSIGSYTTLKLKGGIKDFGRVKGLDFTYLNYITKFIDDQIEYKWSDLFHYAQQNPQLKQFVQNNNDIIVPLKYCLQQVRSASVHASAVVIFPKQNKLGQDVNIFDWVPVRQIKGVLVSEWEGKYIDKAGFLKQDILGLSQLDKLDKMLKLIQKNTKQKIKLDEIELDDEKTYKYFSKGYNEDIFQFGSAGLKNYSIKVKPDNIEDLIAMNALFRPGAMSSNAHIDYADFKHGKKKIKYDFGLRSVTEQTQGLIIYQEQVMKSVVVLGGLTLVEAENFRTAIKKFKPEIMLKFKEKFLTGAAERHCPEDEALRIWEKLLAFSGYSFNKSHSAAYSITAYWAQWFKVHYPLEFWTTSLHFSPDEEIPNRISEMKKINQEISINLPDINKSSNELVCDVKENSIYWSMSKIKNVASVATSYILQERTTGKFTSIEDFVNRVNKSKVNKRVVCSLILSGCFDKIENISSVVDRRYLLYKFYEIIKEQMPDLYLSNESTKEFFWINIQRDLIGLGDIDFKQYINKVDKSLSKIYMTSEQFLSKGQDWKESCIAGKIMYFGERKSKKGKFGVLTIQSNNEILQTIFWNTEYVKFKNKIESIKKDSYIIVSGKIKLDDYRNCNVLFCNEKTKLIEI